ncbi:MAG: hypothetical protein GY822_07605 [Deltaproteobacteria bacterium]|nr:hypothetical protein [Deltaproteobacteria bacterium]
MTNANDAIENERAKDQDDPLLSERSLEAAGFRGGEESQKRFMSRIMQGAYRRADLPTSKSVLFGAAAALCGAGSALLVARGVGSAAAIVGGAGVLHAFLFAWTAKKDRKLMEKEGDASWVAAYRDDDGKLLPRMDPDENIVLWRSMDGDEPAKTGLLKNRKRPRFLRTGAALFQTLWGTLLGGLPIAVAAGGLSIGTSIFLGFGTFIGTAIFGRGIRTLLFCKDAEAMVLTNRRMVLIADTGAARSFALADMEHRPMVLGRSDENGVSLGHTVAFDVMPLTSVAPLPMKALVGMEGLSEEEAREWAGACMDERQGALRAKLVAVAVPQ